MKLVPIWLTLLLGGCAALPDNITPVTAFEADRYLGKWYEIARLDHRFERGLTHVTADYSVREDGGLTVVNRGLQPGSGKWKESVGKAYFVGPKDQAYLKVSFFGPFYGSYIVFDLEREHYAYALVSGPDKSYFWLLSRTPHLDEATLARLLELARSRGFDTAKMILVKQD